MAARKNTLSVMMVHAPCALDTITRKDASGTPLKMCDPNTGGPVKQVYLNEETEETFTKGELGRAVEVSKGAYRQIDQATLNDIEGFGKLESIEIESTAKVEQIPIERIVDAHYVQPDGGSLKPLALIYEALRQTDRTATAKMSVGTRQRLVTLVARPEGLLALTLLFDAAVKEAGEDVRCVVDAVPELSVTEIQHAVELMDALDDDGAMFVSAADDLVSKREEIVQAVLSSTEIPTVTSAVEVPVTAAQDLDAAIRESLAKAKPKGKAKKKAAKRKKVAA
jgi:DNA end-binding protein Ku